jgi:hypothetical protein
MAACRHWPYEGGKRTKGTIRTSEALPRVVSRKARK